MASSRHTPSARTSTAPDASVFPVARDEETGQRALEELAFEVASTEALSHAGRKAQKLASRGVRRIFAIDVTRKRVVEWSVQTVAWAILEPGALIDDRVFAAPLPVRALVSAAKADDAMAAALLAKGNPVLIEALGGERHNGKLEGHAAGQLEALFAVLEARGLPPTEQEREQLEADLDPLRLDARIRAAVRCVRVAELIDL